MNTEQILFDDETWNQLPNIFNHLPNPIRLHLWSSEDGTAEEVAAIRLVSLLSESFKNIDYELFPRRANYNYYPVFGVMGIESETAVDHHVRIIGLPAGYQMTSLITAIQSVSFLGMTSEAKSRIQLMMLKEPVSLELITSGEDEVGPLMAQIIFNFAVVSPLVKSYLIMADSFEEAYLRYSISYLPHIVINERYHLDGVKTEEELLEEIARLLKKE